MEASIQDNPTKAGDQPASSASADGADRDNDSTGTKRRRGRRGGRGRSRSSKTDEARTDDDGRSGASSEAEPAKKPRARRARRSTKTSEAAAKPAPEPNTDADDADRPRRRRRRATAADSAATADAKKEPPKRTRRRRSSTESTDADAGSASDEPPKRTRRRRSSAKTEETPEKERPKRTRRRSGSGTRVNADAETSGSSSPSRSSSGDRSRRSSRSTRSRSSSSSGSTRSTRSAPAKRSSSSVGAAPRTVSDYYDQERLYACQRAVGYHFRDITLLENALTHSSVKNDQRPSYERLEFLGDSVIGLIVAEYIYRLLPECDEGELTKIKSLVVSTTGLADAAQKIGLEKFLAVGRGIRMKNGPPQSLIADVFEAVTGAVYLDRGYEAVRLYVLDLLRPFIEIALSDRSPKNFKSVLQQVAQRHYSETPRYEVQRRSGPDHARMYDVMAVVGGRRFAAGRGPTKKDAEQAAAKKALQTILREKSGRSSGKRGRGRGRRSRGSRSQ